MEKKGKGEHSFPLSQYIPHSCSHCSHSWPCLLQSEQLALVSWACTSDCINALYRRYVLIPAYTDTSQNPSN